MSTIRLPMPHPGQKLVRQEAQRFNVLSAGRRWRKTTLVMPIAVEVMLRGGTVVWGAPTYDQVQTAYEEMQRACRGVASFRRSPTMDVELREAGRCLFRSLDNPDNARSKTAHLVVVDEAADVVETAWTEVLLPMLMDTQGGAWLMGTPKGMNWFFREWSGAKDHADSMAWQIPTVGATITPAGLVRTPHPYENPHIPFEEIERQFSKMPEARFRQEILAEFVEDAGGVFRGVMACATGALEEPRPGHFVLGVDWGKHQDFTVLVLFDVQKRAVVDFDRFNQIDWHLQRRRLVELVRRWEKAGARVEVVAEANSMGESQIEELRRAKEPVHVQPFVTTGPSKTRIIEALQLSIETKRITYPNLPTIVNELQAYEQERLPAGAMRFSAPEGMHDDVVMALAIANDAAGPDCGELDIDIPSETEWAEYGQGATF